MSNLIQKILQLLLGIIFASLAVYPAYARQAPPDPERPDSTTAFELYIPVVNKPFDFYISDVEATQGIQNLSTPVRLVASRQTLVRVYARTISSLPISGLSATLRGYRDGILLGDLSPISGSAYPNTYSIEALRADKLKSFNFILPGSWISKAGDLTLEIGLDDENLTLFPAQENYQISRTLKFIEVPVLNVVAVPIKLVSGGYVYPSPNVTYLHDALMRMYPVPDVNLTIRDSWTFVSDMNRDNSWETLLNQIADLHDLEVGLNSNTVYFAVVPLIDAQGFSWFDGSGIVGIGYLGYRVSVGISDQLDNSNKISLSGIDTAAHEIGHNMGRLHTYGCGAASIDIGYPYANGRIGQYGLRFSDQFIVPANYYDIMNYCDNQWISDYTYNGMMDDQLSTIGGPSLPEQDSLFVRAKFTSEGTLELLPAYTIAARPNSESIAGEYSLQFLNKDGLVISEHPLAARTAQEGDLSVISIRGEVPLPVQPFTSLQLLHDGKVASSRSFSGASKTMKPGTLSAERLGNTLNLKWVNESKNSMVRFSSDGGLTWKTLGVDLTNHALNYEISNLPTGKLIFQVIPSDSLDVMTVEFFN